MTNCLQCKKDTANPKFCSKSCSVSYNNKKQPKRKRSLDVCVRCSKPYHNRPSSKHKYCSGLCSIWHRFELGKCKDAKSIKPKLIKLHGNKCQICKKQAVWMDKNLVLILDHIDGNRDNNMPLNLRLVCPNCDSQLPTYKAKNLGNGRHKRRQRYAGILQKS